MSNLAEQSAFSYSVKQFEGPLDLLLHLIQKAKINIYDIPIAEITEQFLAYLESMKEISLEDLTEFYAMAAHLIYMKSRLLIPTDELEEDEEFYELRSLLVERLLEYQKYKKYSALLASYSEKGSLYIQRNKSQFNLPFEDHELFKESSVWDLLKVFTSLLKAITPDQVFNVYEEVTTKQKLTLMAELFEKQTTISFLDIVVNTNSPMDVICAFFALLEAAKFGMIALKQSLIFGDILIEQKDKIDVSAIEESSYETEFYDNFVESLPVAKRVEAVDTSIDDQDLLFDDEIIELED
jgi:segregation and condensation protein A